MDLRFGPQYEAFRAEVREFLRGWPLAGAEAKLPRREREALFRARGIERGYVYREIPREYGGSGQPSRRGARAHRARGVRPGAGSGELRDAGREDALVRRCSNAAARSRSGASSRRALTGEDVWCQGYSEPGAGSDLASLASRARLEGDEWVIDGHKIWTSSAHKADFMFGLFRTEPDAPKHAGISYLLHRRCASPASRCARCAR